MDCTACREAISARLDDETMAADAGLVEGHLAGCAACRAYLEAARGLQRRLRSRPAEPAPDLTLVLGDDAGASVHVARELGSFHLSLAVGFLVVAWRPGRAAGLLPVVAVLAACLTVTGVVDVAAGRTPVVTETHHLLDLLGLGLVWLLADPTRRSRPAVSG